MGASRYNSVEGRAVKPIHRRIQRWQGFGFETLEEVGEFIAQVDELLDDQAVELPGIVSVTTGDREYRDLEPDDLRDLSPSLSMESIKALSIQVQVNHREPVRVELVLTGDDYRQTELTVEGRSQVIVGGIAVGIATVVDERFERLQQERELAESEAEREMPVGAAQTQVWNRWINHPWTIHIGGGTIAAVVAGGILFLLFH